MPAKSDEHDAAAAAVSHLPHLLAEARRHCGRGTPLPSRWLQVPAMPQVAATAPDLVRAMCEANAANLAPAADRIIKPAEPCA